MKKTVLLKKANFPSELVALDTERGTFSPAPGGAREVHGNCMSFAGQEFGVFASDGDLYFQWNSRRWSLRGLGARVKYEHDFQRKTTIFSIDGERIEYVAWWVGDVTFDPGLPERDEDEDFLAYVARLARDDGLQQSLIKAWDR